MNVGFRIIGSCFQATSIVNGLHLHLLPSMNPDGFQLRSRNNAKNIDLNRDFPDQVGFSFSLAFHKN